MKRAGKMVENEISIVFHKIYCGFGKANYEIAQLMLKSFSEIN